MLVFGRRALFFAALVAGIVTTPSAARAYCRTTTQPLPANYSPSRGCFTAGLFLYWKNACVSYSINKDASRTIPFDVAKAVIDASFATWMNTTCPDTGQPPGIAVSYAGPATCAEVRYNKDGPNQNLIVFRDDGWPYQDPNSTLALTTVTFNSDTGEIFDADMEINSSGRNLSVGDPVPANGFDLASVITHEVGHFFGLAHATNPTSTMYASYKPGSTALRSLTVDDVAGLCAIYPNETIRTATPVPSVGQDEIVPAAACDPTPRHGYTAACEVPRTKDGCAFAPGPRVPWGGLGSLVLITAGLLGIRRRRG